jgi:DNA repair photolyase
MNLYRGCQHQCIYCDSRSACYQIEDFADVLVKVNAIELLEKELAGKRQKGIIGTGAMSDPYIPLERQYGLTGRALAVIARRRFPVHIVTKSDLVLKDLDTLREINKVQASVSFTITTADDALARKLEPGAPSPSQRFRAMEALTATGIHTGVTMMPILPFIEDDEENIRQIVSRAAACGAKYVIPWFAVTLRDRQRVYFYAQLDRLFPGMRERYEQTFGERYECRTRNADRLEGIFQGLCRQYDLATRVKSWEPEEVRKQLSLF